MISSHIYMNKKDNNEKISENFSDSTDIENNNSDLGPEYIITDGDYDIFIVSLFLFILILVSLIIWFIFFR